MSKYIVVVNNKYIVTVEAESLCGAEHVILDRYAEEINRYHVITGCQAFGKKEAKTDFFFEMVQSCETLSISALDAKICLIIRKTQSYELACEQLARECNEIIQIEEQIRTLQKQLKTAIADRNAHTVSKNELLAEIEKDRERIGAN